MATIRLVPSTYSLSSTNTSYISVTNPSNMYNNTDHTSNYASIKGRNSNNTYYCYLKGFNFSDVPSNAIVSSFSIKIRAYRNSYASSSSSYYLRLCHGTTTISNTTLSSALSTSSAVYTFPTSSLSWSTITDYGSNFGISIPVRRASSGTPYIYVYGAEIEVTYTVPNPRTITSTLTGSGTINPSGAQTYYDGDTYTLTITPANAASAVAVTKNNVDVSSDLIAHYHSEGGTSSSTSATLGTYTLVSGGFNGSGASYFSGLVGKSHTNSSGSSNYYSSGSGTIAVFTYNVGVTLPSDAVITGVTVQVSGHAESTSQSSEYMCVQLVSSDLNTEFTSELNFKDVGTSNSVQTLTATTLPTVAQAANMKLQCRLGYYGGALGGATVTVTYTSGGTQVLDYYTYSYTVNGNATIAVILGTVKLFVKIGSNPSAPWVEAQQAYKKVSGAWILQTNMATVFESTKSYIYRDN